MKCGKKKIFISFVSEKKLLLGANALHRLSLSGMQIDWFYIGSAVATYPTTIGKDALNFCIINNNEKKLLNCYRFGEIPLDLLNVNFRKMAVNKVAGWKKYWTNTSIVLHFDELWHLKMIFYSAEQFDVCCFQFVKVIKN